LAAIALGRADLTAGRLVDLKEIDDWIDSVGTPVERELPSKHSVIVLLRAGGRQVNLTARAGDDIIEIGRRLASAGLGKLARAALKAISLAIKNIAFTPLGSPVSQDIGLRERAVTGCTIVYDDQAAEGIGPCAGDVTVLHIFGKR
jgi:hypothetical protein